MNTDNPLKLLSRIQECAVVALMTLILVPIIVCSLAMGIAPWALLIVEATAPSFLYVLVFSLLTMLMFLIAVCGATILNELWIKSFGFGLFKNFRI